MADMKNYFTLKEMERMDAGLAPWESMSFACGGWLQYYLFGVGKALQESGMDKGVTYCGCSAGALTAVGLALGGNFDEGFAGAKSCIPKAYGSISGLFQLHKYVSENVDKTLSPHFTKEKATKVQIAATSLPFLSAVRLKEFDNAVELKEAILASCAAFPAAQAQTHKGTVYLDGGLSDFQPIVDENTVTVSPFYFSNCDIKPSRYVPLWWAFMPPNSDHTVDWLYRLGYEDCLRYLEKRRVLHYVHGKTLPPVVADAPSTTAASVVSRWEQLIAYAKNVSHWTPAHELDSHKTISLRRFLGYDLHSLTNYYVALVLDFVLLVLVLLVWKPLALCLIYAELLLRIVWINLILALKVSGVYSLLLRQKDSVVRQMRAGKAQAEDFIGSSVQDLSDCLLCVLSLSLVSRFVSGMPTSPSSVVLRKHDRLAKHSLLYRIFCHIL